VVTLATTTAAQMSKDASAAVEIDNERGLTNGDKSSSTQTAPGALCGAAFQS